MNYPTRRECSQWQKFENCASDGGHERAGITGTWQACPLN